MVKYLRTTKNLYSIDVDSWKTGNEIEVFYSYITPVAFKENGVLTVSQNQWSVTTGRHLTWIDGGTPEAKKKRVDWEAWQALKSQHGIFKH